MENNVDKEVNEHLVKTLKENVVYLEKQIKTIKDLMVLKDEKIKFLENQLNEKETELNILNEELAKSDEELEHLKLANLKVSIINLSDIRIPESDIFNFMNIVTAKAKKNLFIVVPEITDLIKLGLYDLRTSISTRISCKIDLYQEEHSTIQEELGTMEHISIKNYDEQNYYVVLRDNEELFFGFRDDKQKSNTFAFTTEVPSHIRLYNSLLAEIWMKSRKVED